MAESFRILSPAAGAVVGRTVTLAARQCFRPLVFPRYGIVQHVGPVRGVRSRRRGDQDRGSGTGRQRECCRRDMAAPIEITVTVEGARTDNVGTEEDPVEEIGDFTESESVHVVTESTFPDVRFDPYPHDVTVSTLPYRFELTGTAVDVGGDVASVRVSVDGLAPVTARNVSGDWSRWAIEFELATGHHTLRATAHGPPRQRRHVGRHRQRQAADRAGRRGAGVRDRQLPA